MAEKRRQLLDPCHSKVLNITNLQIARTKLKMKLELRSLKKITGDILHDGGNTVVLPANVYENPLDTILNQSHEGIIGHYGSATEEQLKTFFGVTLEKPSTVTNENATKVNEDYNVSVKPEDDLTSDPVYNSVTSPDEDMELQNAIWQICPESNDDNKDINVDSNECLMVNAEHDQECVLFDLN